MSQINLDIRGSGTSVIQTITGNSGGPESPTGGNFNIVGTGSITTVGSTSTETIQLTGLTNKSILYGLGTATVGLVSVVDNGVLVTDATGVPSLLANGTAGYVLTAQSGAPPAWAASGGSSGALTLLQTQTVSGSTGVAFNSTYITGTYSTYCIQVENLTVSNSGVGFIFQVSVDNGSNYLATGYNSMICLINNAGSPAGGASTTEGIFAGYANFFGSTGNGGGQVWLRNIGSSANSTFDGTTICPQSNSSNNICFNNIAGFFPTGITINNLKFTVTAGTFSGTFSIYGLST